MDEFTYYLYGWIILGLLAIFVIIITFIAIIVDMLKDKEPLKKEETVQEMIEKLSKPNISKEEYAHIAKVFIEKYSKLPPKKDVKNNKGLKTKADESFMFLESFAKHHKTDEKQLIELQKKLISLNPDYKEEITQHINKSLKSKG